MHDIFFEQVQVHRQLSTCSEMTCPCTSTPLRLFIRSLAQVDLANSTQTSPRRLNGTPISTYAFRIQRERYALSFSQTRRFSSQSPQGFTASGGQQSGQASRTKADNIEGDGDFQGAFVDFSPESIDAIVADIKPSKDFDGGEESSIRRPKQRERKEKTSSRGLSRSSGTPRSRNREFNSPHTSYAKGDASAVEPVFRRSKTENTSFKLHYSAPPRNLSHQASIVDAFDKPSNLKILTSPTQEDGGQNYPAAWSLPGSSKSTRSNDSGAKTTNDENWKPPPREAWQVHKEAMKKKFPDGWKPPKKLSPDALAGIRALHAQMPEVYTTAALAQSFEVSPEAIRRILKSKWSPNSEEESDRAERWFERGKKIYTAKAAAGEKPPKRWRELGIGNGRPEWLIEKRERNRILKENGGVFPPRPPLAALLTTAPRKHRDADEAKPLADSLL